MQRPSMAVRFDTGDGIQNLPALKSLHVEAEYFGAALSSPTVTRLCLEGTCGFSMKSCPSLAEFPALKRLELKLMPDLEVNLCPEQNSL